MSSTFGELFRITTFGESHGGGVGVVIDGMPPGFTVDLAAIQLEPIASDDGRRRMRLAIVNDDMPFLVDSIAAAIGAQDLDIDRLIHPVVRVTRDASGALTDIGGAGTPESMIYIEIERVDARERRELVEDLHAVLADVRAALQEREPRTESRYSAMLEALRLGCEELPDIDAAGEVVAERPESFELTDAFVDAGGVMLNENPFTAGVNNRRNLAGGGLGLSWARTNDFQLKLTVATRIGSERVQSDSDDRTRGWLQAIKYF